MNQNCDNRNPLQRDGTSQAQRLLKALLPEYVAVDERKIDELLRFAQRYATEINYYSLSDNTTPNGTWEDFLDKTISPGQRTDPHFALFLAFLDMFKLAQDDLNTITKRHLDFYYRDVLGLTEKPAAADQVFMIFELAGQLTGSLVKEGTKLNGGKDSLGKDLIYTTDNDIVVNRGKVSKLSSIFLNKNIDNYNPALRNYYRIYASPVSNSADGNGAPIETEEKRWSTFGRVKSTDNTGRLQAETGFAIASPVLFLAEGSRTVTFDLTLTNPLIAAGYPQIPATGNAVPNQPVTSVQEATGSESSVDFSCGEKPLRTNAVFASSASNSSNANTQNRRAVPLRNLNLNVNTLQLLSAQSLSSLLRNAFKIYFTGEKGWMQPEQILSVVASGTTLRISCLISPAQKAVIAYDSELHLQPFVTKWPVAKIVLNTDGNVADYFYHALKDATVKTASVTTTVNGVRNLVLQNDDGILATDKPFQPFGSRPVPGSSFYIGSEEVFQKKLTSVTLNIDWHELPVSGSFSEHYQGYLIPNSNRTAYSNFNPSNTSFLGTFNILHSKQWLSLGGAQTLFNSGILDSLRSITLNSGSIGVARDPELGEITELNALTRKGFIRMNLGSFDFGHSIYQNSYAQQAIWNSVPTTRTTAPTPPGVVALPKEPYTPTIKELTLNYVSTATIDFTVASTNAALFNNRVDQFFHVEHFGVAERHPYLNKTTARTSVLPSYTDEGYLYIGVENLEPPSTLSLLFKVAEGSANPDRAKENVNWYYLYNNEWYPFAKAQILGDSSNGLLSSGIVTFDIPRAFSSNNTLHPAGLFWIRASIPNYGDAICDLIDIHAQAVAATFTDNSNDPAHLITALPAGSVSAFVSSNSAITKVEQKYASFNGHPKETSESFYTRVSERLRHKNRMVTIWDYEHMVLEKFPNIYKVKCLNHTEYSAGKPISEMAPGHVSLVVIPDLRNRNAVNPLKPKASLLTLTEINDFVVQYNPPCAMLHVRNPLFEEAQAEFNVRFLPGYDRGFYQKQLAEDLRRFLAPWAYGESSDLSFGGKLYKSTLINFVEERPYVDFVSCFKLNHLIDGVLVNGDVEILEVTSSASVITSATSHKIEALETDDCECPGNEIREAHLGADNQAACDDPHLPGDGDGIGYDIIESDFVVGRIASGGVDFWQIENDFEIQ